MKDIAKIIARGKKEHITMSTQFRKTLLVTVCLACYGYAASAFAQTAEPNAVTEPEGSAEVEIPEIVVTATKRSTKLQDTPISIAAYGSDYLARNNVRDFSQIANAIPNVRAPDGLNGISNVSIRGISSPVRGGTGVEQPVGTYIDQVFAGNSVLGSQIFDIGQIEVVRGPQGTLFGRNTAAGAISFTSTRPSFETEGYVNAEIGNYALRSFKGAISTPIVEDQLAIRVAAAHTQRDGYIRRLSGGSLGIQNSDAARISVLAKPTENLKLTFIGSYADEVSSQALGLYFSGPPAFTLGNDGRTRVGDVNDFDLSRAKLGTLTGIIEYQAGQYTITSITGFRRITTKGTFDEDQTVQDLFTSRTGQLEGPDRSEQFSQELRLTSPTGGLFDFTTGLYYYSVNDRSSTIGDNGTDLTAILVGIEELPPEFGSFQELAKFRSTTKAYAWYGQGNIHLSDTLTVIAGFRLNRELKTFGANASGFKAFDAEGNLFIDEPNGPLSFLDKFKDTVFTPMGGLQYKIAPDIMAYATYSQGYKSGGFNADAPINPDINPFFKNEKAKNYEVGIRSRLFDRRLTLNATAFWFDYTNLQTQEFIGLQSQIVNAGKARSQGFELQLVANPLPGWTIDAGLGYTNARYTDFVIRDAADGTVLADYTLNRLPFAPRLTSSLSSRYEFDLGSDNMFALQGEWTYSSSYFQEFTNDPEGRSGPVSQFNGRASVSLNNDKYEFAIWGRNLSNAYVKTDYNGQLPELIFQGAKYQAYGAPRTFGGEIKMRF
jgi:iron complex outermembrane recepter protein